MSAPKITIMENHVTATATEKRILLSLKKNEEDITFIRSLGYAWGDNLALCWVVPKNRRVIDKLNSYFHGRITWKEEPESKAENPVPDIPV